MGTARTRGLGRVEVKLVDALHEDPGAFQQRLLTFDAAVRTQAQSAGVRNLAPFYLALTLHSPAILRDFENGLETYIDAVCRGFIDSTSAEGKYERQEVYLHLIRQLIRQIVVRYEYQIEE